MNALTKSLKLSIKLPTIATEPQPRRYPNNGETCTQITNNIFIGGYVLANDINFLKQNNITNIINCAYGSSQFKQTLQFPHIQYLLIPLHDNPGSEILQSFYSTIDFIERTKEGNILIHCIEGISRGPALLTGYLMWKNNSTKEEVMKFIKSKRECIDINFGFMVQLGIWEQYIMNNNIQFFKMKDNGDISFLAHNEVDSLLEGSLLQSILAIKSKEKLYIINPINTQIAVDNYIYYLKRYDYSIREIKMINFEEKCFSPKVIMDKIGEVISLSQ